LTRAQKTADFFNHKEHRDHKEKLFFGACFCAPCALCGKMIPCVVLFGKGVLMPAFVGGQSGRGAALSWHGAKIN
jgi:hypothetical protein